MGQEMAVIKRLGKMGGMQNTTWGVARGAGNDLALELRGVAV